MSIYGRCGNKCLKVGVIWFDWWLPSSRTISTPPISLITESRNILSICDPILTWPAIPLNLAQLGSISIPKIIADSPKYFRHIWRLPPLLTPISRNLISLFLNLEKYLSYRGNIVMPLMDYTIIINKKIQQVAIIIILINAILSNVIIGIEGKRINTFIQKVRLQ